MQWMKIEFQLQAHKIVRIVQIFIQVNGRDRAKSAEKKNNAITQCLIAKA